MSEFGKRNQDQQGLTKKDVQYHQGFIGAELMVRQKAG